MRKGSHSCLTATHHCSGTQLANSPPPTPHAPSPRALSYTAQDVQTSVAGGKMLYGAGRCAWNPHARRPGKLQAPQTQLWAPADGGSHWCLDSNVMHADVC